MLSRTILTDQPNLLEALDKAIQAVNVAQELIVISPRNQREALDEQEGLQRTIRKWSRIGKVSWLNVGSPEIDRLIVRDFGESKSQEGTNRKSGNSNHV